MRAPGCSRDARDLENSVEFTAMQSTRINVEVHQEDIDRAMKNHSSKCVVATALARTVKDVERIDVDMQTIRFSIGDKRMVYLTPWRVQDYIVGFDAGETIEPFQFQIRDPQITERARARGEVVLEPELSLEGAPPVEKAKPKRRQPRIQTVGGGVRVRSGGRVPPQSKVGYRTHTRVYGRRIMRVNQARSEAEAASPG
jgi:hypothetical protein